MVGAGAPWRLMPSGLPPWYTIFQQTQRWLKARGAKHTLPSIHWATFRHSGTVANEQDGGQAGQLAEKIQEVTGQSVELACVDQGCTGEQPAQDAATHGLQLEVIKLPESKKGFVLLPRRRAVERSLGWAARSGEG